MTLKIHIRQDFKTTATPFGTKGSQINSTSQQLWNWSQSSGQQSSIGARGCFTKTTLGINLLTLMTSSCLATSTRAQRKQSPPLSYRRIVESRPLLIKLIRPHRGKPGMSSHNHIILLGHSIRSVIRSILWYPQHVWCLSLERGKRGIWSWSQSPNRCMVSPRGSSARQNQGCYRHQTWIHPNAIYTITRYLFDDCIFFQNIF